ncbi:hypothetical protein HY639_04900 [Candidatus Woesearchaeota archaeon]|nr:hypothetical protein [Candidatus Woesearchaeota archaeon]
MIKPIIASLVLMLVFGIPTAVIPNSWFTRMTPAGPADYFFLVVNSILFGMYLTNAPHGGKKDAAATSGGVANALAISCPLCNKLLIAWLGTSTIITYVDPARLWIGLLGTVILGTVLWRTSCRTCKTD